MAEENQQTSEEEQQPTQPLHRLYGMPSTNNNTRSVEKVEWPELVGVTAEEAESKVRQETSGVQIQVIPPNSFVTMDFRQDRIRLYVDAQGKVARAPRLG